jgi:phosphoribosylanthranilate isomerase
VGFVFHRPSPRFIETREAADIVKKLPRTALTVGVFVDFELERLNEVVAAVGLRAAQLHGAEDPSYARAVRAEVVIKAVRVGEGFRPEAVLEYPAARILLDTHDAALPGGTGKAFDWTQARRVGELTPFILAGGLTPENVESALEAAQPEAIDVSSGVESAPGVKDRKKIARLFEAVARFAARR